MKTKPNKNWQKYVPFIQAKSGISLQCIGVWRYLTFLRWSMCAFVRLAGAHPSCGAADKADLWGACRAASLACLGLRCGAGASGASSPPPLTGSGPGGMTELYSRGEAQKRAHAVVLTSNTPFGRFTSGSEQTCLKCVQLHVRSFGYPPSFVKRIASGPPTTHKVSAQSV